MAWSGGATVGFNADGNYFWNERQSEIGNISCLNTPATVWNNVIYQLRKY